MVNKTIEALEASPSLAESLATMPYKDLHEQYLKCRAQLAPFEEQRKEAAAALDDASMAVRRREQWLIAQSLEPGEDEILDDLWENEADARSRLYRLPERERKVREVVKMYESELARRETALSQQVRDKCLQDWQGKSEQLIETCRKVLAQAALAHCAENGGDPKFIDVAGFAQHKVLPGAQQLFRQMAEEAQQKTRQQIIKHGNGMLGE